MLTDRQREFARQQIRVMRIIWLAVLTGASVFAVILLTVLTPGRVEPGAVTILTYAGLALGVINFVAANVVTRIMAAAQQQALVAAEGAQDDETDPDELGDVAPLTMGYLTRLIIACALLEGAAMLNGVAYFIEGQVISLGVMGALIVGIVLLYPGRSRVEGWLDRKAAVIRQERQWTRLP